MKLVVTGGGTGGHVFPALETALAGRSLGWDVTYLGSLRGQEGAASEREGVAFRGFQSGPVYHPFSVKGARSILNLLRASSQAGVVLREIRPDVIFATGGYAAAPVLNAARKAGIPLVLHEQNTVPGRTNRLMSPYAYRVCTVFKTPPKNIPADKIIRTGMPIRQVLRDSAQGTLMMDSPLESAAPMVLVMGGSQGSAALNDLALATAVRMARTEIQWLHVAGTSHFESTMHSLRKMAVRSDYTLKSFLSGAEMASALFNCSLSVCRSGAGSLAELAAFRRPSILIPYPQAFGNHQYYNALEFQEMGAAELVNQGDLQSAGLEARLHSWLTDKERHLKAQRALAEWDLLDAVPRILTILTEAAAVH